MNARRRWASILILVADAGMLFWTAMAALAPERLLVLAPERKLRIGKS
jgi:hypothetical protein